MDLPYTNRQKIVNTLLCNLNTHGYLLSLEVDQIFVVVEDLHICEATPSSLDFLSGKNVLRFLVLFLLSLLVTSPCPLDLNSCDMVHGESVILEESPRQ